MGNQELRNDTRKADKSPWVPYRERPARGPLKEPAGAAQPSDTNNLNVPFPAISQPRPTPQHANELLAYSILCAQLWQ